MKYVTDCGAELRVNMRREHIEQFNSDDVLPSRLEPLHKYSYRNSTFSHSLCTLNNFTICLIKSLHLKEASEVETDKNFLGGDIESRYRANYRKKSRELKHKTNMLTSEETSSWQITHASLRRALSQFPRSLIDEMLTVILFFSSFFCFFCCDTFFLCGCVVSSPHLVCAAGFFISIELCTIFYWIFSSLLCPLSEAEHP